MYSFPPIAAAIELLYRIITGLNDILMPAVGPLSAAFAIVGLTVLIRLVLLPLTIRQVRAGKIRAQLAPRIRELQRKHARDPQRLQRETMAMYAAEGTTPFAGCLPMLVQAPVFMVLYGLFVSVRVGGEANALLTESLAGVPLSAHLVDVTGTGLLVFGALLIVLVAIALGMRRLTKAVELTAPGAGLIRLLPFGTVVVAAIVPLAAGIYLATTTAWTLLERTLLT